MDPVKDLITKALPEASEELISNLLTEMAGHGVKKFDHLKVFDPETDASVLSTIEKRLLKKEIEKAFAKTKSQEMEEAGPSNFFSIPISTPAPTTPAHIICSPSSFSAVENFEIPYHKFPKLIDHGKVPSPSQRLAIVRIVCDDLQEVIEKPLKKHLEIIARKIVERYPSSFQDTVKHQKLGTGYSSLLCQLINRCENTRRPISSSSKRKLGEGGKMKKIKNADTYGCIGINYLPDLESDDDACVQEVKKEQLQEEFMLAKWDDDKVAVLMNETYTAQGLLIVKNVEIDTVIAEFPFLSVSVYFLKHVEKLLGFDVLQKLTNSIEDKAPEVIMCIKNSQTLDVCKYQFIEILCEYFEEEKKQFLMTFDEDRSISEIASEICPLTPLIVALGCPYVDNSKCVLLWGKSHFGDFVNFKTAVAMWFSSFYVFNLKYPETLEASMEFIQRAFLDINPEKGSKATKTPKLCNINKRVRKLTMKLATFRWRI